MAVAELSGMMKMRYDFSNVTPERLAELFPIVLRAHDPDWAKNYLIEKSFLEDMLGHENIVRISHYGSTSVPGLLAKPTIDVLLEIKEDVDLEAFVSDMENNACVYLYQPNDPAPHIMFLRGYTPQGFTGQAVHIHVRYSCDPDELYFRDYLAAHPEAAKEYGLLKLELKEQFEHDRDGYTAAKGAFIRQYTKFARTEYGDRYKPDV